MEVNGVKQACEAAGSQAKMARALGVTEQAIHNWVSRGWVPLKRAMEIEALFGVKRELLINPRVLDLGRLISSPA